MTATSITQISPAVATELAFRLRVLGNAYFSVYAAPDPDSVAEFHRLFKDPLTMPCPPWQSASDAPEDAVPKRSGAPARQALAWYRRFGFQGVS